MKFLTLFLILSSCSTIVLPPDAPEVTFLQCQNVYRKPGESRIALISWKKHPQILAIKKALALRGQAVHPADQYYRLDTPSAIIPADDEVFHVWKFCFHMKLPQFEVASDNEQVPFEGTIEYTESPEVAMEKAIYLKTYLPGGMQ